MSCTGRASCPRIGSGALRDDLGRHGALARDQHQLAAPVADREAVVVARLQRADNVGHLVLPGPGRRRPVPAHHHPSADVLWPDPDHVPVAHRTLELTGARSAPEPERGYPGSDSEIPEGATAGRRHPRPQRRATARTITSPSQASTPEIVTPASLGRAL